MPIEGLGWTFDTVAEDDDRYRPTYPDELYRDLFAYCGAAAGCRVLEIGAGTGQATAALLAAGCHVTAVEPGSALADIVRRKFQTERLRVAFGGQPAWRAHRRAGYD